MVFFNENTNDSSEFGESKHDAKPDKMKYPRDHEIKIYLWKTSKT